MDNIANTSKEKKVPKGKDSVRKSKRLSSSEQKENRPKTQKRKKKTNYLNGSIAMSRQLLEKGKTNVRRQSARNKPRVCPNGKPMPSLAELEAMYNTDADSDEEKPSNPLPAEQKPEERKDNENVLLSPNSIKKLSERMMEMISNISDPVALIEEIAPPLPVIPQKKRRKSDVPYIVGCTERPQVPKPTTTSFCKGDKDYGVPNMSIDDMDDDIKEPPRKKGKQSKIRSYTKSIFNIHSEDIAKRLINDESGVLSDASDKTVEYDIPEKEIGVYDRSPDIPEKEIGVYDRSPDITEKEIHDSGRCPSSDSNKTVEYDSTQYQRQRPIQFSPLPSTSRDTDTFIKNDERFNESLKELGMETNVGNEMNLDERLSKDEGNEVEADTEKITPIVSEDLPPIELEDLPPIEIEDLPPIEREDLPPIEREDLPHTIEIENSTPVKTEKLTPTKTEKELELIEPSYDTIVLDDDYPMPKTPPSPMIYGDDLEIIECNIPDRKLKSSTEEDVYVVGCENSNKTYSDDIYFVDEYKNINFTNDDSTDDVEIIDVDELIAKNQSLLLKYKTNEPKITAVIEVPNTPTTSSSKTASSNNNMGTAVSSSTSVSATENKSEPEVANNSKDDSAIETVVNNFFNQNATNLDSSDKNKDSQTSSEPNVLALVLNTLRSTLSSMQTVLPSISGSSNINQSPASSPNKRKRDKAPERATIQEQLPESNNNQENVTPSTRNFGECPICMEALGSSGLASTICGHVFCLKCIQTAIKASGKRCPTCRKVLKGAGYHQIYL